MAHFQSIKGLMTAAALAIALVGGMGLEASAQTRRPSRSSPQPPANPSVQRRPSTGNLGFSLQGIRPSRQRIGGFARGACVARNASPDLTAVQPVVNRRGELDIESTIASRPTLFIYVPPTTARQASLILTQEDDINVEALVTLPNRPGVVGITLPVELEVDKPYHWSLALICDEANAITDPAFIEGWLQRKSLDASLTQAIARTPERDRPALFARSGFWQDTLTSLATLRLNRPTDVSLNADWNSLMRSVNLTALANVPIVQLIEAQITSSDPLPLPAPPPTLQPPASNDSPPEPELAPVPVNPRPALPPQAAPRQPTPSPRPR